MARPINAGSGLTDQVAQSSDVREMFSLVSAEASTPSLFAEACAKLLAGGIISPATLSDLLEMHVMASSEPPTARGPRIAIIGCANGLPDVKAEIDGIASLFPSDHVLLHDVSATMAARECGPMPFFHFAGHTDPRLPGHDMRPVLLWTNTRGGYEAVDASTLEGLLRGKVCVVLNGCKSSQLGESLTAKGLVETCVCWETLTATDAACLFGKTFWRSVAHSVKAADPRGATGRAALRQVVRQAFGEAESAVLCCTKAAGKILVSGGEERSGPTGDGAAAVSRAVGASTPRYALVDPEDRTLVSTCGTVLPEADKTRAGRIAVGVPLLLQPLPAHQLYQLPELPPTYVRRAKLELLLRAALLSHGPEHEQTTGALAQEGVGAATRHISLVGVAGLGKTALATWLARDMRVQSAFPDGIAFLHFGPHGDSLEKQRELATWCGGVLPTAVGTATLGGDAPAFGTADAKPALTRLLAGKRMLLICDDVCDASQAEAFRGLASPSSHLTVITTTRSSALVGASAGHRVERLPQMGTEEACTLLAAHLQQSSEEMMAADETARELNLRCKGLPGLLCAAASMVACAGSLQAVVQQLPAVRVAAAAHGERAETCASMPTHEAHSAPLGTRERPISRGEFVRTVLPQLAPLLDSASDRWRKVAPTLLLYPNPREEQHLCGQPPHNGLDGALSPVEVPGVVRTLLRTREGQTFEEALMQCQGKALLLNFCTPSLEVYPKDAKHCALVYDMDAVTSTVVPEESEAALLAFLSEHVRRASPLVPNTQMDVAQIFSAMHGYRQALGRSGPWRLGVNKAETSVIARKLTRADVGTMLSMLLREVPYMGERVFREESYSPLYEFGIGDWVCLDVDPKTGGWRLDAHGYVLVRTINELSFESTYQRFGGSAFR